MIWIDASFAIEWLVGSKRAESISLRGQQLGILPMQYLETLVFFQKRMKDSALITEQLDSLELRHPTTAQLHHAAYLYVQARHQKNSKASLADALMAAVARDTNDAIASFDLDLKHLGLTLENGLWHPVHG